MAKDLLLLISDREALAWVLTEQRMAFPASRARLASQLSEGDRVFLYTTRGCFHNPTRDRGRVIGEATIQSTVRALDKPVQFGDRTFPLGCDLAISGLTAKNAGVDLSAMVRELHMFPDPKTWSVRLRKVLVPLDDHDAALIHGQLAPSIELPQVHRPEYLRLATRPTSSDITPGKFSKECQ